MTPRNARPISRWISTVRPSWRPWVTSRCLRSPVDAGSIPYSAVIQPRPRPTSHFGTDSWTEAVQITRVSPQEISAEPVAVRTKPGSIVVARSSSGARPSCRLMPAPAPDGSRPARSRARPGDRDVGAGRRRPQLDAVDLAERHLQEARAERMEAVRIARAQEAVLALCRRTGAVAAWVREPADAEDVFDLARHGAPRR